MVLKVIFELNAVSASVKHRVCVVLAALIVIAALPYQAYCQNPVSQSLAAAAAAEQEGNYSAAAARYLRVLEEAKNWPASPAIVNVRVQLAKDYFLLRRYEESLNVLKPGLKASADHRSRLWAQVALVAGMDQLELNELPAATENLYQALSLDPESGTARLALGDAYARSNHLDKAAQEYREQLQRTPSVADAWYKLAAVYSKLSDKTVQDFVQRDPNNPVVRQLTAELFLEKGDSTNALHLLFAVLSTSPGQPDLRADFGRALLNLGHIGAAAEQFHEELSRDSGSPVAMLGLAEVDALQNHWEAAFRLFLQMIQSHPRAITEDLELPPPKPLRAAWQEGHLKIPAGEANTRIGKLWANWLSYQGTDVKFVAQAGVPHCASLSGPAARVPGIWLTQACYEELRSAHQSRSQLGITALTKLAEADYRLGHYGEARAVTEDLLRRQPSNGWAAYWLARSYSHLAYSCLARLSSVSPGSARVHEILAQLDAARFNWARAEREYKSAIRLAPGLPDLHLGLGTVYWQAGNWTDAEAELENTLRLDPASSAAEYELGDCYVEQHKWTAAVPHLQRAVVDSAVNYRARLDLAQAEEETGDDRSALQDLLPVANEDRDGVLHYRLALLFRKTGDATRAQQELALSQKLRRSSAQAAQEQIQRAEEDLQKLQSSDHSSQP
jgi:predicted Zn-dependent protease